MDLLKSRQDRDIQLAQETPVPQSAEMIKLLRERQKQANTNALIAGASGALGEFLFGGAGHIAEAGYEIGSQQLKRKEKLEDQELSSLMATMKARSKGSSGSPQKLSLIHPKTGDRTLGYWDPNTRKFFTQTGKEAKGYIQDYKASTYTDPYTKEKGLLTSAGNVQIVSKAPEGAISPKAREIVETNKAKFNNAVKKSDEDLKTLTQAKEAFDTGTELGLKTAAGYIMRLIESGRMSDEDRRYYLNPIGGIDMATEILGMAIRGDFRDELKDDVKLMIDKLIVLAGNYHEAVRSRYADQMGATGLISAERAYKELGGKMSLSNKRKKGEKITTPKRATDISKMTDEELEAFLEAGE